MSANKDTTVIALAFAFALACIACGGGGEPADINPCGCEEVITVEHCVDGSCSSADLSAFFESLCPTRPPLQSCDGDIYTVVCDGHTSLFRLAPADNRMQEWRLFAGEAECTLKSEENQ